MNFERESFDEIDKLVLNGGLKFAGSDPLTGEALYKTTDKLKELDSKLKDELSIYFSEMTLKLWEKGFLEMDVTSADPLVTLGPKAFNRYFVGLLEKNERIVIDEIIKVLFNKK